MKKYLKLGPFLRALTSLIKGGSIFMAGGFFMLFVAKTDGLNDLSHVRALFGWSSPQYLGASFALLILAWFVWAIYHQDPNG